MDIKKIINRIKQITGAKSQKDVATLLNLSESDFSNRKKRETLLVPVVNWAVHENVNLNWLITGKTSNDTDPESNSVVDLAHKNVILKFKDKETAKDINANLVQVESLNQKSFLKLAGYIERMVDELKYSKTKKTDHNGSVG